MAKRNEGETQQSGFFGRIFGSKGKSPIKAKLGEQNSFVYDEKLKRWVIPGEKIDESAIASAPPPMSRAASSASMGDSEGGEGHRRTGSSESLKRGGAAARYANPGLLSTNRSANAQSSSISSIIPSPAKPPLVPTAKASVFVPGNPTGAPESSGPRFFIPGGASASQGASSRFAGFKSKAQQVAPEETNTEQSTPDDTMLSPSKPVKTDASLQQGAAVSMDSELTLAKGVAEGIAVGPTVPSQLTSSGEAAEESVGENIIADATDSAVTSPGPKMPARAGWGLPGVDQSQTAAKDPEEGTAGNYGQGGQYSGGFGLGLEDNFSQVPSKTQGQAQEYFGADTTAPVQTEDAGGYGATYSSAVGEYGAEDAGQATWEQVQQWVDYYRQEGYTEDQLQDWIASTYPQFAQQHAHKETIELLENTEAAETTPAQEQTHVSQTDKGAAEGQGPSADERLLRGFAEAPGDQLRGSTTGPTAEVAGYGTEHEVPGIDRSKIQSETLSNMADCGSSRGHLDDVASVRMVGGEVSQPHRPGHAGLMASESSASGKLTGPLPWEALDDRSDEENSTAGTPRFELAFATGEAGNASRPALAGAAFAEAAEQAGSKFTGWVTGLVRSGVQSHLAANSRFPRAPFDITNAPSSPSVSVRSGNTSTRAQHGTPTSVKSGPVDDKRGDAGSLPPSAKAARYGRGAFDNESVLSEAIIEEEPKQGMFESTSQEQETTAGVDGWAGDDIGHAAPAEDGWDLDASALDNLPLVSQGEQSGPVGEPAHSDVPTSRPGTEAEKAGEAARIGQTAQHLQGSLGQLQPTWLGDLPQPDAHSAGFAFDTSVPIPKVPSGVGTNGGESLMGESPQAGWEGDSELGFPLDDVPKESAGKFAARAFSLDLPEAAALTPLKVPPVSPLRTFTGGAASARPSGAAAAAVIEAFAHGGEDAQLAALQARLEEVIALHQHAATESETLRDQNSALELELADLKTQLDADVAQARQAQNVMAAKAHLEEQLEELWQEVEQLRVKNNALKADNATLLADRAAGGAAAAHSNGDVKSHAPGDGADAGAVATAADLEAARQRIAELEAQLEEGGGAEAAADLEAQITELMEESQALAEESLNKDEEIEVLEAQLARTNQALSDAQQGAAELANLREEASAANAEVVSLGDALESMEQETTRLNQLLATREAELAGLRAEVASMGSNAQLLGDLQSQLVARELEIARLEGELSSKADELERTNEEGTTKEAALQEARATAAKKEAELTSQLCAAEQAVSDAQAAVQRLTAEVSHLQEAKAAEEQRRGQVEAELKTLKENAVLDFERIGLLSEENAALQEKLEELEAAGGSGSSVEVQAEVERLKGELAAALARAEEADARAKNAVQEKETFGKRGAKLQAKLNRVQAEAQEKQTQLAKDIEDARAIATASAARAAEAEAKLATLAQGSEQFDQSEAALKAEIAVLSAQVLELQTAMGAEVQRRQETEEQLACTAQKAAEAAADKQALTEDLATHKAKVADLQEEATSLFEKVSAAEEEVRVAEVRALALADKLKAAQAMQTPAGESGAGVEEELAQAREAAAVQEKEFGELLACLGQESAKSAAFQELLLQHGIDPSGVLAQVEADYGFGDEAEAGDEEEEDQEAGRADEDMEVSIKAQAVQEAQSDPTEDAAADQEWAGFSAKVAAEGTMQQGPTAAAQNAKHAQRSSMEGLPEGELLSPDKELPRLRADVKSEIVAGVKSKMPAQQIDFDSWGADAEGDWDFN